MMRRSRSVRQAIADGNEARQSATSKGVVRRRGDLVSAGPAARRLRRAGGPGRHANVPGMAERRPRTWSARDIPASSAKVRPLLIQHGRHRTVGHDSYLPPAVRVLLAFAFWIASISSRLVIRDRPLMSSRFATSIRCVLLAFASTPPVVSTLVFRLPAALASLGPFLDFGSSGRRSSRTSA